MPLSQKYIATIFFGLLLFNKPFAQNSAGEYLDVIGKEFNEIQKNTWDYTRSVAHGKSARNIIASGLEPVGCLAYFGVLRVAEHLDRV